MNRTAQLICIWCGPAFMILLGVGAVNIGGLLPPWAGPDQDAVYVAQVFWDHANRIRLGAVIMAGGMGLVAPWGAAMAVQTRRREGRYPVLTYAQLTCAAAGTAMILVTCMFWGLAAFRPHGVSPDIVQFCHDAGWFFFLCTWCPFAVWCTAIGLATLLDKTDTPVYPRWAGYLSIWAALLVIPGGMIMFFRTGPLAYNGILGLYIPVGSFSVWVITMTVLTIKNIKGGSYDEDLDLAAATATKSAHIKHAGRHGRSSQSTRADRKSAQSSG